LFYYCWRLPRQQAHSSYPRFRADTPLRPLPPADPSSGAIQANPGQTIILGANATVTYSGTSASGVPVTANVYAYLYQGGAQKAEAHKTFSRTFDLSTGNTYPVADTMTITVPADATPGDYPLKIVASASAEYMGPTYNQKPVIETRVVKVLGAVAPGTTATPTPSSFGINSSTVTTSSGGNITYKSADVTGNTSSGATSGNLDVNLAHVPEGSLTMHMQETPDPAAATQFMLAAAESGSDIKDIACVLVVDHPTLANGADISSETITMTVSKAWVDAHDSVSAIKILRYSDGVGEALATTCTNPGGDSLVFQAFSPHGLSQFALAAVAQLPVTAAESGPVGVQVGTSVIIGIIAVIIIVPVAIIAVVYLLRKRGQKKKQE
jgi:hypothetical protein